MIPKEIQQSYSCKRKKDYVTIFAISFFLLVVVMEIYIVLLMPFQLRQEDIFATQALKENVVARLDRMRVIQFFAVRKQKGFPQGELVMASRVFNLYANYLREYRDELTYSQLMEISKILTRYEEYVQDWDKGIYHFQEHSFDLRPSVEALEKKYRL